MIIWTSREWQLIAKQLMSQHFNLYSRGFRTSLAEAQKAVLPRERQRPEGSFTREGMEKRVRAELLLANPPPEVPLAEPEPPPPPVTFETLLRQIVVEELSKMEARIVERLTPPKEQYQFGWPAGPAHAHNPHGSQEIRKHKPRIYVVGVLNGQQSIMRQKLPEYDLRFFATEKTTDITSRAKNCDHAILRTNYCGHHQLSALKAASIPLHYVDGGVEAMIEKVREIAPC